MRRVAITRPTVFMMATSRSRRKHKDGEQAEEEPESSERRMPHQSIDAQAGDQPVDDEEQQDRGKEVEQKRRRQRAQDGEFTQHRIAQPFLVAPPARAGTGRTPRGMGAKAK